MVAPSVLPPLGSRVRVHRNLHRAAWSVSVGGRVVAQVAECCLHDARTVVLPGQCRRSLARGTRTVSTYLEGTLADAAGRLPSFKVTFRKPTAEQPEAGLMASACIATDCYAGRPLLGAAVAVFCSNGSCWVGGCL